jgi:dTDP-4-dehydrorhamnose reductase
MPHKKILITGGQGFIGGRLAADLAGDHDVRAAARAKGESGALALDAADPDSVRAICQDIRPAAIVHLAGLKDLKYCESHADETQRQNTRSTQLLADQAKELGAFLIFISSDYVFDGERGGYAEDDATCPATVYGRSKADAETYLKATLPGRSAILRSSAIYGKGGRFFDWIVRSLEQGQPVDAFEDAIFTPTHISDVIYAFRWLIRTERPGVYHVANPEPVSRFQMARAVARHYGFPDDLVRPARVADAGLPIARDNSLNSARTSQIMERAFLTLAEGLKLL